MGFKNTKIDKYDRTFSLFIKTRDVRCQRCGRKDQKLECSHIFSRSHIGIRCDPMNAKLLCFTCHRWWHENPTLGTEWLKDIIGDQVYLELRLKAKAVYKMPSWRKDEIRSYQVECIAKGDCGPMFNKRWVSA